MIIRCNRLDYIDNLDASTLLDNIFDNALYACAQVDNNRNISVKLNRVNNFVVLVVTDTIKNPVVKTDAYYSHTGNIKSMALE